MSIRRPRSLRVLLRTVVALAVVGAIATAAVAATSSHGTTYRTAVVTRAEVDAELHEAGTIEPLNEAAVAFPISGTVASVAVKARQKVRTGQTLATVDTSTLLADLTQAEATLAADQLTLDKVRNGEQVGGGGSSSPSGRGSASSNANAASSSTPTTSASSGASTSKPSNTNDPGVQAAQRSVAQAEQKVQAALTAAQKALQQSATACASTPPTTTPTTTSATSPSWPSACTAAQQAALRALEVVATAEQDLSRAEQQLGTALSSSGSGGNGQTSAPSTTPTTTPSTTVTYSGAQIKSYEAAVAAAAADVTAAQQALAQATIVSPIAGTIASVNLAVGDNVSAASSTADIVVVGNGGYEVATSVTVADRAKLKVGDRATMVPDGTSTSLSGRVVAIGVVESTSNNASTYAVTIGFTGRPTGLRNGASAAVTIVTAHTANALTVPTSAVHSTGGIHTVTVIANGKTTTTPVQIGTVGATRTVVTSGLRAGQVVSLADVGASIPSSNTGSNGGTFSNGLGGGGITVQRFAR